MFLYFAYAVPLTRKTPGFYDDGVWAENGHSDHQIGGIAWRQGEPRPCC